MQNQSCFGGRLIVAPLVHLLLIPSTPMQLKLINNPLCYLTDQIIIREVQLKSCHTLIKKCSFNFFEQCIYLYMNVSVCLCVCRLEPVCMREKRGREREQRERENIQQNDRQKTSCCGSATRYPSQLTS